VNTNNAEAFQLEGMIMFVYDASYRHILLDGLPHEIKTVGTWIW
jgi:hypothetical protein